MFHYSDDTLKRKIELLNKDLSNLTPSEKSEVKDYKLNRGLLYKTVKRDSEDKELYVVPKRMRKTLVIKYHDLSGHLGIDKCMRKISKHYYFPSMKNYVKCHINMCVECILSKNRTGKQPGYLHPIPPGKRPFAVIHMDHLGPFITSSKGNKYVLSFIDNLTKFVQLEPVKSTKTEATILRLENFIFRFGAPERIITDRGTSFTSSKFEKLCEKHGIKHTLNSSRHPQANGLVERLNSTILPMMQASVQHFESRDWDKHIKKIERDVNTSINKTTNKTPFELLYGYIPRYEDGQLRHLTVENEKYTLPEELREEVRERIQREQRKYKERYDKHRYEGIKYNVGDIVYVKSNPRATGESTKLQQRYRGPNTVIQVLPNDTYRIRNLCKSNGLTTTAHVSQLKVWKNNSSDVESEEETEHSVEDIDIEANRDDEKDIICDDKSARDIVTEKKRVSKKPAYLSDYEV